MPPDQGSLALASSIACFWRGFFARVPFALLLGLVWVLAFELGWLEARANWLVPVRGLDPAKVILNPQPWPIEPGEGAQMPHIYWLGHSGFFIEWAGQRLLLDPNFSPNCKVSPRLWPSEHEWLPSVDAVLISHAHYDHLDLPSLAALSGDPLILLPSGSAKYLEKLEPKRRTKELDHQEVYALGPLRIRAWRAKHGGSRYHPFHFGPPALGYLVEGPGETVFFAGDTGYGPHFAEIGRLIRPGIAILPIGAYEPRWLLKPHHLNPEDALRAAQDLGAMRVIPCHFGTFRLALEMPLAGLARWQELDKGGLNWDIPYKQ